MVNFLAKFLMILLPISNIIIFQHFISHKFSSNESTHLVAQISHNNLHTNHSDNKIFKDHSCIICDIFVTIKNSLNNALFFSFLGLILFIQIRSFLKNFLAKKNHINYYSHAPPLSC